MPQGISEEYAEYVKGKLMREPPICTDEITTRKVPLGQITEFTFNFVDPLLLNDEKSANLSPSGLEISMVENDIDYLAVKEISYSEGIGYG